MQETAEIEDIEIPKIDIRDIQLKPYNSNGIRLYIWNDMVRCDLNGKHYFTSLKYLRLLVWGKLKFCYFSDNYWTDEERKVYLEKKEAEFKERVKYSLLKDGVDKTWQRE